MPTVSLLGSLFNTSSGSKTVGATPSIGDLILIVTAHDGNTASIAPTDDQGGTYSEVTGTTANLGVNAIRAWVRDSAIASAIATNFTHAPGTSTGGGLAVIRIAASKAYGLSAIRQVGFQEGTVTSTPTVTLPTAANAGNPIIGALINVSNPAAMVPRAGYTELLDTGHDAPTTGFQVMVRNSGETTASITWGSSTTFYGAIVVELDNEPEAVRSTPQDPSSDGSLRGKYVECGFVASLCASLVTLLTLQTDAIQRLPVYTPVFSKVYQQVDQVPSLLPTLQAPVFPGATTFSQYDWVTPEGYRYYIQTDIPQSVLGVVSAASTVITRGPLETAIYPRPYHQPQYNRAYTYAEEAPPADPLPPLAVDLTYGVGYRPAHQPEYWRPDVDPTQYTPEPPVGREGPFLEWDWPNPVGYRSYPYHQFDPPNLLFLEEEFQIAFDEFDTPDPARYFPQPDQIRNVVVLENPATALFAIQNVEGIRPDRYKYRLSDEVYPNLTARDGVITPPPPIRYTEWHHSMPAVPLLFDVFPNLLLSEGLPTALYPIFQNEWPNPRRAKWFQRDDFPNLQITTLKPGPLANSLRDWTPENPEGWRYSATPDPVPNLTIQEMPPAPELRFPFQLWEWPNPRRADSDWSPYFIAERGYLAGAVAPPLAPVITLTAVPSVVTQGFAAALTWNSTNASVVTASGGWSGSKALSGTESTGLLTQTTTYTLTASGPGGTAVTSVTVTVQSPSGQSGTAEVRPAGRIVLEPKLAGHTEQYEFDFISSLPRGDAIVSQNVTCQVYSGVDSNAALMVVGGASVSGTKVSQRVGGGVAGAIYQLRCTIVTAGGNSLVMTAFMAVTAERRDYMAGGRRVWNTKKQGETVTIPFDFVSDLQPTETITVALVNVSVYSGVDAAPSGVLSGIATISGTKVLQNIRAGTLGVTYALLCRATTSAGQILEMTSYCTIHPNVP